MQFELTKEFLSDLSEAIAGNNRAFLEEHVLDLHPADIAEILNELDLEQALIVFRALDDECAADALTMMDEDDREEFLENLTAKEIADQVGHMDTDDAADIIGELDLEQQQEVFGEIKDAEYVSDISQLLSYREDQAGSLMAKEFIKARMSWNVRRCIIEMRKQAEEVDKVYTIYVVDEKDHLTGTLSLKSLLFAEPNTLISQLYMPEAIAVKADHDREEVAAIFEKYDLIVLPVVDEVGRLIGRITVDDVMDVIREEAEKDYKMASGITTSKNANRDSIWHLSRTRLPWLFVALIGGILGAFVIAEYETELKIHPEMAYFIPLIAAMGGNVGIQSSAIVVQGLASSSIQLDSISKQVTRELMVGIVNGVICAGVILGYNAIIGESMELAITVSSALLSVILFAATFGTFIPLVLDKYDIDPAIATGPFITTTNDILGVFIYFMVGRMMYGM